MSRLNSLAPDCPDIAFAATELARSMSGPTKGCQDQSKRLGRYFITRPSAVIKYKWQAAQDKIRVCSDADLAGCKVSWKFIAGGVIMLGQPALKTWSKTQSLPAVSSGGSEFYASRKA